MSANRRHRGAQRLAADSADVVVHPDACQVPQGVIGGATQVRAPIATYRSQTSSLQLRIVAWCERFKPDDQPPSAVLARAVRRLLLGVGHDHNSRPDGAHDLGTIDNAQNSADPVTVERLSVVDRGDKTHLTATTANKRTAACPDVAEQHPSLLDRVGDDEGPALSASLRRHDAESATQLECDGLMSKSVGTWSAAPRSRG